VGATSTSYQQHGWDIHALFVAARHDRGVT